METEITCRIPRETLVGLLDTMDPIENQRITAEMPAVEAPLDDPPEPVPESAVAVEPPPELVVRFKEATALTHGRVVVIGASFVISICIGLTAVWL